MLIYIVLNKRISCGVSLFTLRLALASTELSINSPLYASGMFFIEVESLIMNIAFRDIVRNAPWISSIWVMEVG